MELPRLEAAHPAARVGEREDDPTLEVVVAATVREPDGAQLVQGVVLLRGAGRKPCGTRRVAEPELAADLLA